MQGSTTDIILPEGRLRTTPMVTIASNDRAPLTKTKVKELTEHLSKIESLKNDTFATLSRGGTLTFTSTKVSNSELLTIIESAIQGSEFTASDATARNANAKTKTRSYNFELFVSCRQEDRIPVFNEVKDEAEKMGLEAEPFFVNSGHIKGGPNYFFIKVYGGNAESAEILLSNLRKKHQFIEQSSSSSKVHGRTGLFNMIRFTVEKAKPKTKHNKPKEAPTASSTNFPPLPSKSAPASIATPAPAATAPTTTTMASAPIATTTNTDQATLAKLATSMAVMATKMEEMQTALVRMQAQQAQTETKQAQMEDILIKQYQNQERQDQLLQAMTGILSKLAPTSSSTSTPPPSDNKDAGTNTGSESMDEGEDAITRLHRRSDEGSSKADSKKVKIIGESGQTATKAVAASQ